ncbi:probable JmjC domain-containing histone demethylation protein 2C isoform X2 [Xenopus tropicalis]|uniref:Probable JmjC domain-containing histone demethylation protein 2C n=1 Tax=Xenopus tropicalis TaxID=8364 RepID=A0A8J1JXC1_XENTR|nr:probable JmjC domain-containing histone demethylation protein 2C isoform X2 [Xenopus tropicalis]
MALGVRPELVGKRFVCLVLGGGEEPPEIGEIGQIGRWGWRAGVIRAVSHRDSDNPELAVYVEFDDLEWDKREWVKVYEDFTAFFVEYQLVWAKRKDPSQSQGSKVKHIQWPALAFKPLVGKGAYNSITAIEFLVERHLEFATEDSAFQPYQDEVDSLNPVLRDNPQLHEEVKAWVKEHKVQEIFMQGPYSLNGYRVRVYRQDSATQWFTGIITHHDLFTRTMIVMNDQVLEPQNVDPSMVQMTFLDDVVYSLLKGENIGITSRRRSRSNQNSNTIHGHYTRAQANSPRPAMNSQSSASKQGQQHRNARLNKRKGSDSSMPDEDRIKEERYDGTGRAENLKRNKHFHSKRRKPEEDEKKLILKRLRTDNISDFSESSDSENSNKRIIDSSSEQNSENELKSKNTSKINGDEGKSQSSDGAEEQTLIDRHSPWDEIQDDKKEAERMKSAESQLQEDKPPFLLSEQTALYEQNPNNPHVLDSLAEKSNTTELLQMEPLVSKPPTPKNAIVLNNENNANEAVQESGAGTFGSQPVPKVELQSGELKPSFGSIGFSDSKRQDTEQAWNEVNNKGDLGVLKNCQSAKDAHEREKIQHGSVIGSTSLTDEQKRLQKQTLDAMKAKPHIPEVSSKIKYNASPDVIKSRSVHSPDPVKQKMNYHNSQTSGIVRSSSKLDCDPHRSSFHPVAARVSAIESTKSPLIIDKNEHFTVYRDPALVGPETAANHISSYLHQHNFALHSPAHRTCLPPNSHHPALTGNPHLLTSSSNQASIAAINTHPLGSASHHPVHHPHLLPTVLPGMTPGSLLGGHPQLETAHASSLSHLALAHQQQQQMLQHQSPHLLGQAHPSASYNQLGLYPIIWQYPNGSHAYSGLGLPSSKWVHAENHVGAEASIRRNTASPWLHQPTPVTSAESLLIGHLPVRPSSADAHRPIKLSVHSSPPLSKPAAEHHKEEIDKKAFSEPLRSIATVKSEHDHGRTHAGKDSHMSHIHRHYMEPVLSHSKLQRVPQDSGERPSKYKEEHRRILQENTEASPFPMKVKAHENERDSYPRVTSIVSSSPKSHVVKQENNIDRHITELYKLKNSVSQSLPQSNYFTTLSNSVVNDPPRSFASKEVVNLYPEKQNCTPSSASSTTLNSYMSSLSKPPPLIKHQPEEVSAGKLSEPLSQQVTSHTITSYRGDSRSPTQLSISSTNTLRSMPALHRAPVFHPPIHHSLERKDASYSNLSPPTLTPVQPVSTGSKIQELQKPPTLVPEPKEGSSTYKKTPEKSIQDGWKANEKQNISKGVWIPEKSNGKVQAATASVIVRPSSSAKYDPIPMAQNLSKERVGDKPLAGVNQTECLKPLEPRETARITQPPVCSDGALVNSGKGSPAPLHVANSVAPGSSVMCSTKTDVTTSAPTTTSVSSSSGSEVTYSLSNYSVSACAVIECNTSKTGNPTSAQTPENQVINPAPVTPASGKATSAIQPNAAYSSSSDFIHLKKHKAALAAAQLKSTNANETEPSAVKNPKLPASSSPDGNVACSSANALSTLGNGPVAQPNYHTKLKKAWLTRHSEEDKNINKPESAGCTVVSEIIKPCTVNLIASTSEELQNNLDLRAQDDKSPKEDRLTRRRVKRTYESGSESEDSDESESRSGPRLKRQPKPTYKKKQNDMQRRKGDTDKEEECKPNGILSRSAKEKSKLKLQSSSGNSIPRSVLKDWRKVKKLKQTGESFLQDDSCCEIGPNLQKCRECRLIRTKKGEESTHSPVFCRFYYFRRLSFSKNGVVRIDGFSSPDQYDDEALSLWSHEHYEDDELDLDTIKYILAYIGDKFCQLGTSEKAAVSWVKKDAKIAWKRAVRGVREMCDACEATLFNIHWVCQKCGFVVCLDCYKAKERKISRDKELYTWMKCVKGQPHDYKHLMPTQIIPSSVLTDLLEAMHHLRDRFGIKSHCHCASKPCPPAPKYPAMNGVSQVLQNVLNHSNKISLCLPESPHQSSPQKPETNGNASPGSDSSTDSKLTSSESHSSLHWLADLAEQKSREEKKENKECPGGKHIKEERDQEVSETVNCKSSPTSHSNEQGSTLRDLLTTTAGKLRLGSTDAGIAFAPVYSASNPCNKGGRSMPNILDDIIASVVENKIPATKTPKPIVQSEPKEEIVEVPLEEPETEHQEIPHSWICDRHILWLKDHKHSRNWKMFQECWKQGKTVVVSGTHKRMNANLWKLEAISSDFGDHQGDLLNCKEGIVSSGNVTDFWEGFEDVSKRQKVKNGETVLLKLKDQPSGEDFKNMMLARHEEFFKMLPVPEYCNPDGKFNLASHMPSFFVRPDLGPRMCSAYGVIATKDQDTGTTNLHIEVSDLVNILVYVGAAKGLGVMPKSGVLKKFEEEELDEHLRKRLKDSGEVPGSLWHIYETRDADKIREFLHKAAKEQCLEILPDHDPIRDQNWYLSKKLRQSLLEDYGVKSYTLVQFLGDAVILPAGAIYQVQNFHSCIQVTQDFVSPEHLVQSFHLTQELRHSKEEINYDDKLQVKNILYHSVKEMVRALKIHEEDMEEMEES